MMSTKELRDWFHDVYVPTVMVLSTERVSSECEKKNGLSLCELLAPFGRAKSALPFRTPGQEYSLKDFRVQFIASPDLEPIPQVLQETILQQVVHKGSVALDKKKSSQVASRNEDIAGFVSKYLKETSWMKEFRRTMTRTFQHEETQMFGQPIGCMIVVSSLDSDVLGCFEQLSNPHFLPSGFQKGQYDPNIPKFYVILHDKSDPMAYTVDVDGLRRLRNSTPLRRGDTFDVVEIENNFDSRDDLGEEKEALQTSRAELWHPYVGQSFFNQHSRPGHKPYGFNLTDTDIETLRKFASSLMVAGILQSLESRLIALDARVTEKRRGLRNTVRRFWRPSAKSSQPGTSDVSGIGAGGAGSSTVTSQGKNRARYLHDTIESQVRVLADLAFMVQDYDMALANYRIAREDFSSDKTLLHHAAVLEMMAVSTFMKSGAQPKTLEYLGKAFTSYLEAMKNAKAIPDKTERNARIAKVARYFTNCALLLVDMISCLPSASTRLYHDASNRLAWASMDETPLAGAVLLEQTGMFLLYQELSASGKWSLVSAQSITHVENEGNIVGRLRKYGFHLAMASDLYLECGNIEHALRCLLTIRNIYSDMWPSISDHIDLKIGDHATKLEDFAQALPYYGSVLNRGNQPDESQIKLVQELRVHLSTALGKATNDGQNPEWAFNLPIIDDQTISVAPQVNASLVPPVGELVHKLEEKEASESADAREDSQDRAGPLREAQKTTHKAARRKEEAVWKSMQEYLDKHSRLDNGEKKTPAPTFRRRGKVAQQVPETCYVEEPLFVDVPMTNPCACSLDISHLSLLAEMHDTEGNQIPAEKAFLATETPQLALGPRETRIVRLSLSPMVPGKLRILGARWKLLGIASVTKVFEIKGELLNDNKENRVARARAEDLRLQKTVLPSAAWLGAEMKLPQEVFEGQLIHTELELINLGKTTIVGPIEATISHASMCFSKSTSEENFAIQQSTTLLDDAGKVVQLPVRDLEPGLPLSVPVCIRVPRVAGLVKFRVLFKYKDSVVTRSLRLSSTMRVRASVKVAAECFASPLSSQEHLLSLSFKNLSRDPTLAPFHVSAVHALGKAWRLCEVGSHSQAAPGGVQSGEIRTLLFKLLPLESQQDHGSLTVSSSVVDPFSESETALDVKKHFACLENAKLVLLARQRAKEKHLKFKDLFLEEGKLPVSLQEIRRLNRSGASKEDAAMQFLANLERQSMPQEGEPSPCSEESLYFGDRRRLVHFIVEWSWQKDKANGEDDQTVVRGQCESLNVLVDDLSNPFGLSLHHPQSTTNRVVHVTVQLCNLSEVRQEAGAVLLATHGQGFSWMGLTKSRLPALAPGEVYSFRLRAVFRSSGQFELNRFTLRQGNKEHRFNNSFFITVHNHIDRTLKEDPQDSQEQRQEQVEREPVAPSGPDQSDLWGQTTDVKSKEAAVHFDESATAEPLTVAVPTSPSGNPPLDSGLSSATSATSSTLNRRSTSALDEEIANLLTSDDEDLDVSYNEEELERELNSDD